MSCSKDHNSGRAVQAGGDARRLPGLHGSGAGGYPGGGRSISPGRAKFGAPPRWTPSLWISETNTARAAPPVQKCGAVGEGGSQGERRRREEQTGRWAVGRADGRAGGRVCPPSRCSGRGEGGGPGPAALEATTATAPTWPVTTSSAFSDLGLFFMVGRREVPPPLTACVIRDWTDV